MLHGDTQRQPGHMMAGVVTGVPKRTTRPIVDGIVTGCPRDPKPSVATPTQKPGATSATKIPQAAFGSGIFGEGARASAPAPEAKGRGRPKKEK